MQQRRSASSIPLTEKQRQSNDSPKCNNAETGHACLQAPGTTGQPRILVSCNLPESGGSKRGLAEVPADVKTKWEQDVPEREHGILSNKPARTTPQVAAGVASGTSKCTPPNSPPSMRAVTCGPSEAALTEKGHPRKVHSSHEACSRVTASRVTSTTAGAGLLSDCHWTRIPPSAIEIVKTVMNSRAPATRPRARSGKRNS